MDIQYIQNVGDSVVNYLQNAKKVLNTWPWVYFVHFNHLNPPPFSTVKNLFFPEAIIDAASGIEKRMHEKLLGLSARAQTLGGVLRFFLMSLSPKKMRFRGILHRF